MKKETKKVEVVRFVVEGIGGFPFDMLRYDCCFPVHESEARQLERRSVICGSAGLPDGSHDHKTREDAIACVRRRVLLEHRGNGQAPTSRRWASFGWTVIRVLRPGETLEDARS